MKRRTKDWLSFILIMLIFLAGMIFLLINQVVETWIWVAYIVIWTYAEMRIAKNIKLKWWAWAAIIVGIFGLDIIILSLI